MRSSRITTSPTIVPRQLTITFTPEGSQQSLQYFIHVLSSIDEHSLPQWVTQFRDLSSTLKWSDETGIAFLKAAIESNLWPTIATKQTLDTALDALLKAALLASKRYIYERHLSSLRQDDFLFIAEYVEAIQNSLYKWAASTSSSKIITERRKEELFFAGLNSLTMIEMERLGITKMIEIINKIQALEEMMLQFPGNLSQTHQRSDTYLYNKAAPTAIKSENSSTKWCAFHRSSHHDDSECRRALPKRKSNPHKYQNSTNPKNETAHLIKEPDNQIGELSLQGNLNSIPITAILDTGSRSNYISSNTADKIKLHIEKSSSSRPVELGNGTSASIVGVTEGGLKLNKLFKQPGEQNQVAGLLSRCASIKESNPGTLLTKILKENLMELDTDKKGIIMLPSNQSQALLKAIHDQLGHPGVKTLIATVQKYLQISNITKIAKLLRKNCTSCQKYQIGKSNYGKLTGTLQTDTPLEHIASDLLGPIPTSNFPGKHSHQKFWVMSIIDRCTRLVQLYPIYDISPETIIQCIEHWCRVHGTPKTILSDQGRQYTASTFETAMNALGIKQILCSSYSPTSNGIAERTNQTIMFVLRHFNNFSISKAVQLAQTRLQYCYHRSIGCSPIELISQTHPLNILNTVTPKSIKSAVTDAETTSKTNQSQENKRRNKNYQFNIGDAVYKRGHEPGKLAPRWDGPYIIKAFMNNQMACIIDNDKRQLKTNIRHIRPL